MLTRNPLIGFFGLAFLLIWAVLILVIFLAYHAGIALVARSWSRRTAEDRGVLPLAT